jgi:hypothetical protein
MKAGGGAVIGFLLALAGFIYLGYAVDRSNFVVFISICTALFALYFLALRYRDAFNLRHLILAGLIFRVVFLGSEPRLSDDHFRFLWDGSLTMAGENPYLIHPETFVNAGEAEGFGLNGRMYEGMNSKGYYTIYPPVSQAFFAAAVWIGGGDFDRSLVTLHVFLLFFELVLLWAMTRLLVRWGKPAWWILIYALNPLVIVELSGNVHFEGVVLAFLALAALALFEQGRVSTSVLRHILAGVAFGLAVSVKLTPLLILPLLVFAMGSWRSMWVVGCSTGVTILLTFLPFLSHALLVHFQGSLALYFTSFEFNASVYYVLRSAGEALVGYNPIARLGPVMGVTTFISVMAIAVAVGIRRRRKTLTTAYFVNALILSYTLYYLLATTVHPWYITTLVGLLVFASRKQLIIWSFLVLLSYSHYIDGQFKEQLWLIAVEYVLLAVVLWLQFQKKFSTSSQPKIS